MRNYNIYDTYVYIFSYNNVMAIICYTYQGVSFVQYSRGSFFPFFPFLPFGGCKGEENITKYMVKVKHTKPG